MASSNCLKYGNLLKAQVADISPNNSPLYLRERERVCVSGVLHLETQVSHFSSLISLRKRVKLGTVTPPLSRSADIPCTSHDNHMTYTHTNFSSTVSTNHPHTTVQSSANQKPLQKSFQKTPVFFNFLSSRGLPSLLLIYAALTECSSPTCTSSAYRNTHRIFTPLF